MTDGKDPYDIPGLNTEIQKRAYEIWEDEGRPEGRADEHWLRAEHELRSGTDDELRLAEGEISSLGESD